MNENDQGQYRCAKSIEWYEWQCYRQVSFAYTCSSVPMIILPRITTTSMYATYCMAVVWWVVVKCLILVFSFSVCALAGMMGKIVDLKYDNVWNMEKIKKGTNVTGCLDEFPVKIYVYWSSKITCNGLIWIPVESNYKVMHIFIAQNVGK